MAEAHCSATDRPTAHVLNFAINSTRVRKMVKDAIVAISLANLCFIHVWFAGLYDRDFGFFNKIPVTTATLLAMLTNMLIFALLFWIGGQVLRRTQSRVTRLAGHVAMCVTLLVPLEFIRFMLLRITDRQLLTFLTHPLVALAILTAAVLVVRWHTAVARGVTAVLVVLSPLICFSMGKVVLLLASFQTLNQASTEVPPPPPLHTPASPKRFIWLVFDEMDQRVAFAQRPPGLALPELDRLAGESLVSANAYPPGGFTLLSMPSLISGIPMEDCKPAGASDLSVTLEKDGQVVAWCTLPSVFSRARELGLNTALIGWYLPYSRALGRFLNCSEWYPSPFFEPARATSYLATLGRQQRAILSPFNNRRLYVDIYKETIKHALRLVADTNFNLVQIHLPVPHKPGIYLAEKDKLTIGGVAQPRGYLNNLVLSDRTFGSLRKAMEMSGTWSNSWILVTSDHWWRESAVLDGRMDKRIPFILKAPSDSTRLTYPQRFNTVVSADLILAILRGEIGSLQEVVSWLDVHKVEPPDRFKLPPHAD